jgi:hypothetical protein
MPRAATERQLRCGAIALALAFALGSDARAQAFVDVTDERGRLVPPAHGQSVFRAASCFPVRF